MTTINPPAVDSSEQPVVLEYRGSPQPVPWSFRPPISVVIPFSVGTGVGASGVGLAAAVLSVSNGEPVPDFLIGLLVGLLITFLVASIAMAVLCWIGVRIRQVLSRRLLAASSKRACSWAGAAFGGGCVLIVWSVVLFWGAPWAVDPSWLWALPLAGPVIASVALVRVVEGHD